MDTSLEILEQIKTHTADAYDVVEAKGGTIPATKNLANLADAVRSLRREDYGTLYYYSGVTAGWTVEWGEGCEPTIVNQETFDNFRRTYPSWEESMISFDYAEGSWRYQYPEGELEIADADFESTTGIRPNRTEDWAFFEMRSSVTVDTRSEVLAHSLASESSIASLGNSGGETTQLTVDGVSIYALQVKGFTWGASGSSSYVPDRFLASCPNLVEMGSLPSWLTTIGDSFLSHCSSFNQPLDLSNIISIGNNFLDGCSSFNQPLDLSNVTSIGNNFLYYLSSFNQSLTLSNITSIGSGFLYSCSSFNQSLDLSNVTTIGFGFLYGCSSFNQPLDLNSVTTVGERFLYGCTSFNQNLTIPATVTSIAGAFMYRCNSMTSTVTCNVPATVAQTSNDTFASSDSSAACYATGITLEGTYAEDWISRFPNRTSSTYRKLISTKEIGEMVLTNGTVITIKASDINALCSDSGETSNITVNGTSVAKYRIRKIDISEAHITGISNNFCRSMTSLSELGLPNTITIIGNWFLCYDSSFNQSLDLSNVTSIGDGLFNSCSAFNQSLDLSKVTTIGSSFLSGCSSFNQSLDLSSATTIGTHFLSYCSSFNQNLTIPATLTSIGNNFMFYCNSMTSTVNCNAPATVAASSDYTFATGDSSAACYITGITLAGAYASDWHTKFPDRSSSQYRKTIVSS